MDKPKYPCGMCDQSYDTRHEMYSCRHEHLVGKPQLLAPGQWTKPFGNYAPRQPIGGIDYV